MTGSLRLAAFLLAASAASLAACGLNERDGKQANEPFGFVETRVLSHQMMGEQPASDRRMRAILLRGRGHVAGEYGAALNRFTSIYGDGFGPLRGLPEYQSCKAAFRLVNDWIGVSQIELPDARIEALWGRLQHCGIIAQDWAGPAETATFGDDFGAMVTGATLVLGYAAASHGSALGSRIYQSVTPSRSAAR